MSSYEEEIESLRKEINRLNIEIVQKLSERVNVALSIGEVKKRHGHPIVDRSIKGIAHLDNFFLGKSLMG